MICFCSHTKAKDPRKCLSQWYSSEFDHDLVRFSNAEQCMMYSKAILFKDEETAQLVMLSNDPREMKKLGRRVKNYDQKVWDDNKYDIVLRANIAKFSQNDDLKEYLIKTGSEPIAESAHYDTVWGTGLNEENTLSTPEDKWPGENLLGKVLMEVRECLVRERNK